MYSKVLLYKLLFIEYPFCLFALFVSQISDKVQQLHTSWDSLQGEWQDKQTVYDTYLDAQLFQRDLQQAETWLNARDPILKDQSFLVSSFQSLNDSYNFVYDI